MFFVSSHLFWATSHLFQEESQTISERKDYGAVDESSSEQQICESADYTLIVSLWQACRQMYVYNTAYAIKSSCISKSMTKLIAEA